MFIGDFVKSTMELIPPSMKADYFVVGGKEQRELVNVVNFAIRQVNPEADIVNTDEQINTFLDNHDILIPCNFIMDDLIIVGISPLVTCEVLHGYSYKIFVSLVKDISKLVSVRISAKNIMGKYYATAEPKIINIPYWVSNSNLSSEERKLFDVIIFGVKTSLKSNQISILEAIMARVEAYSAEYLASV